jgi:heme/copper-type cytochrome/quinol oxidase subunit 3
MSAPGCAGYGPRGRMPTLGRGSTLGPVGAGIHFLFFLFSFMFSFSFIISVFKFYFFSNLNLSPKSEHKGKKYKKPACSAHLIYTFIIIVSSPLIPLFEHAKRKKTKQVLT